MEYITQNIIVTVVAAARIVGMFLVIPVFSMSTIPSQVRVWLVIFMSLIAGPYVMLPLDFAVDSWAMLTYYIVLEVLTGVSLGLVFSLALNSLYVAGSIIDMGMGFSMVSVYSPVDDQEIPIATNLFYTIALIVFLATNGHHILIRGIIETFKYIEIGTGFNTVFSLTSILGVITKSYIIGIQMALPFILTIIISNMVLGVLSKAMPGLNVFTIGLPLNVVTGLVLLIVIMGYYFNSFENIFIWSLDIMDHSYKILGK